MTREEEIKNAANEYSKSIDFSDYVELDAYDAFIAGVEWADKHQPSPWISVEDRLPEINQVVLTLGSEQNDEDTSLTLAACAYLFGRDKQ